MFKTSLWILGHQFSVKLLQRVLLESTVLWPTSILFVFFKSLSTYQSTHFLRSGFLVDFSFGYFSWMEEPPFHCCCLLVTTQKELRRNQWDLSVPTQMNSQERSLDSKAHVTLLSDSGHFLSEAAWLSGCFAIPSAPHPADARQTVSVKLPNSCFIRPLAGRMCSYVSDLIDSCTMQL